MKSLQKCGRPGISTTYCFDYAMQFIIRAVFKNERKAASFPSKKGDLEITKNYRGITLTAIAAKIYNAMLLNRILPEVEKVLRKNQNGFRRNRSVTSQILTVRRIIEGVRAKNLKAVLLFVDFSKAFESIHRGKMEEILLAYGISTETVYCQNEALQGNSSLRMATLSIST